MNNYFAYGSNLHPLRVEDRLGPAELFAMGYLQGMHIRFNKTGGDGSGKASIYKTDDYSSKVYGAVYKITDKQEHLLDGFESLGKGYDKTKVEVILEDGTELSCFTYQGMPEYVDDSSLPFHWYKRLVVLGAEYLGFPEKYIQELEGTRSVADINPKRLTLNKLLIEKMLHQKDER